ncbi:MAG: oxygenase MpaB family protein, partial [Marmoricola sp.]
LDDIYALWRYVGHLSGVCDALLPVDEGDQRRIQEIYQLTRPAVDDGSRALVSGLVNDYLVPEVAELFPARMPASRGVATTYVNGMIRAVVGDGLADELGIEESRFKHLVPALGHLTAAAYGGRQRLPGGKARRVARGRRYRAEQEQRLRLKYAMVHDLVDASTQPTHP